MTDAILLTIPAGTGFRGVGTLVLGGIGTRLDLPYERIDDLQLALSSVLEAVDLEQAATIEFEASPERLSISIGPLPDGTGEDRGLTKVLEPLVDALRSSRRDGAEWLVLELARAAPGPAAASGRAQGPVEPA